MKFKNLRDHITATYTNLRVGIAVVAIALPFALWIGGGIRADLPLQESMSAYYHSGQGAMRDVFVGVLFAVGAVLYLYKGFTDMENIALNCAGVFIVGVALFPMEWKCEAGCSGFSLHGAFAILFFLSIAYVCLFRACDTLVLAKKDKVRHYKAIYRTLGVLMLLSPAIAAVLAYIFQRHTEVAPGETIGRSMVFFAEAVAVIAFSLYWIIKSHEIAQSNAERMALQGQLNTPQLAVANAFKQASVEQAEAGAG